MFLTKEVIQKWDQVWQVIFLMFLSSFVKQCRKENWFYSIGFEQDMPVLLFQKSSYFAKLSFFYKVMVVLWCHRIVMLL